MDKIKEFILAQLVGKQIDRARAKELLLELDQGPGMGDVAIIGMAGRFSAADDIDAFWEYLKQGESTIRDYPSLRKDDMNAILRDPHHAELLLGSPVTDGDFDGLYAASGYLNRIDTFDAPLFGIPPVEAEYMDPHQRVALEVAHEAFENAGYGGDAAKGSRTGVFLGRDQTNISYYKMFSERHAMQLSGSWEGLVASRISYVYDLKGPCLMTDTACSAGAVSIHQAVQSLALGECEMALAGGINLTTGEVKPDYAAGAAMGSVTSHTNTIRTFDARADGTLWGEGVGLVLLKPLARAVADGDNIRAIIRASAINNDGASSSITAPSSPMQEKVILDAWSRAGFSPETITYVEAHGTGTVLGDPIELKGLSEAFKRHTSRRQFCGIGSLKTTMGHLVAASGVASVAKVVKSLESGLLAPTGNFGVPNPYVDFTDGPLYVNDRLTPWESGSEPRRAGISSFGFIRTNCHLVLEEGPAYQPRPAVHGYHCLTISAKTADGLRELVGRYAASLGDCASTLPDICYTASVGRGHHEHRVAIVAASKDELVERLDGLTRRGLASSPADGVFHGTHALVSDRKVALAPGDVTAGVRKQLTGEARAKLTEHANRRDVSSLQAVAELYVRGAQVEFGPLYDGESRRRVPLPTYPYAQTRYWAPVLASRVRTVAVADHPLLGTEIERQDAAVTFESTLSVGTHWVLADHRIEHRSVLPGTAYLEMARAAFEAVQGPGPIVLSNVVFLVPFSLDDDERVRVRTHLTATSTGHRFHVTSERDGVWTTHVEGHITRGSTAPARVDVAPVIEAATTVTEPDLSATDTGVFQFGPHWNSIRTVWTGPEAVVARLALRGGLNDETDTLGLHPAKLDNAVNVVSQENGGTFLPYMYKEFVLDGRMPEAFHAVVTTVRNEATTGGETITYDIDLVDSEGLAFARIRDYTIKRVDWQRLQLTGPRRHLRLSWLPLPVETAPIEPDAGVAVVVRDTPQGRELGQALAAGDREVLVCRLGDQTDVDAGLFTPDEAGMGHLGETLGRSGCSRVVFAADATAHPAATPDDRRRHGVEALFELTRGLLAHRVKLPAGLVVLTRSAWQVEHDGAPDPHAAATASLAVVVGQENAHLSVEVVDVEASMGAEALAGHALDRSRVAVRAVRDGISYVQQLGHEEATDRPEASAFCDGSFLITGGAGGLGRVMATYMLQQGARRVVLCGRSELGDTSRGEIADLGAEYVRCDIADPAAVERLSAHLDDHGIVLDGIVHAAGRAGDGFLATKDRATFDAVLAPKIDGALAVLNLAHRHPGAFVVLFSSITALTGGQGQGDYCAANAFMDALAVRARAEGVRAVSVNWPAWAGVGMAVEYGVDDQTSPFRFVSAERALEWLEYFIAQPSTGVAPAEVNPTALGEFIDGLPFRLDASLSTLVARGTAAGPGEQAADVRLTGLANPTPTQVRIGEIYAAVLGLGEIDVFASFQDLGGNSLMTAQLLKRLDDAYPGVVDIADLFSYVTVESLAAYVDERTAPAGDAGHGLDGVDGALLEVLAEFGDSDLSAALGVAGGDR